MSRLQESHPPSEASGMDAKAEFLPLNRVRSMFEQEKRKTTDLDLPINWSFFVVDWELHEIVERMRIILEDAHTEYAYVGITQSPQWRWCKCRGHNNMKPHDESYDVMHVLCVDRSEAIKAMEEVALEQFQAQTGFKHKLKNAPVYRTGPIPDRVATFLYMCVTYEKPTS